MLGAATHPCARLLWALAVVALLFANAPAALAAGNNDAAGGAGASGSETLFSDVPRSHWAYDAVIRLAEEGMLTGYERGLFQGDQPVTRYEFAILVARLLDRLPQLAVQPVEKQLVARLSAEFAPEIRRLQEMLGALENRVRADEDGLGRATTELTAHAQRLERLEAGLDELRQNTVGAPGAQGAAEADSRSRLEGRVAELEKRLAAAEGATTRLSLALGFLALAAGVALYIVLTR